MSDSPESSSTVVDSKFGGGGEKSEFSSSEGPAHDDGSPLSDAEFAFKWVTGRVRTAFSYVKPTVLRKTLESESVR